MSRWIKENVLLVAKPRPLRGVPRGHDHLWACRCTTKIRREHREPSHILTECLTSDKIVQHPVPADRELPGHPSA
jgi:hypothetical protein